MRRHMDLSCLHNTISCFRNILENKSNQHLSPITQRPAFYEIISYPFKSSSEKKNTRENSTYKGYVILEY